MNSDEYQDRLVDLLLSESVGRQEPPDVRSRVMQAVDELPRTGVQLSAPRVLPLPSAKRSKGSVFTIAAIFVLFCVIGAFLQLHRISDARTPVLTAISGTVNRNLGILPVGESLTTGLNSRAVLTYPDGSMVTLSEGTTIKVKANSRWDGSKGLEIVSGRIEAEIAKQVSGRSFLLSTGDGHAEVVGTTFSLGLNDDRTRLEVTEGAVLFLPSELGRKVLVEEGYFAEAGRSGFRHERISVVGISRFTLMNADTDLPIRVEALVDGETISLSSLPTTNINIRADFEGEPPASVNIGLTRHDGGPTGLPSHASQAHEHPPFFVAGDHWADGRPDDCTAWTPRPGSYLLKAEAFYHDDRQKTPGTPLKIEIIITP